MQEERKTHWEQVYRDKSPLEVSWYQSAPTLSRELILASAVSVLDISAQTLTHARRGLGAQAELGEGFSLLETRTEAHRTPAGKDQLFNFFRFVKRGA